MKDLIATWTDYLVMAKRLGLDVTDPIIYRARQLVRRHDELVQRLGSAGMVHRAEELEKTYPKLPEICIQLKKYEYSSGKYKIIAPQRVEDILIEGEKLQHCINRQDRYFERMNSRESYILFFAENG